ncbi:cyclic nucleotide-binding domain-containing protein [Heliobacterium undosum]|uniref:Cyclic nucleotide-binding domain-containing protein n=1 Tax=Heliomicrobium undosum TaxID=121734 RepID=A0A845L4V9_9FIRM|nr:Crp/Fnr family transcriptional regulator [Heliomicrobium undosum]MZP30736.1 cyclic nucleotide-binding domain-containing protein [Heliomicrobium undosum]
MIIDWESLKAIDVLASLPEEVLQQLAGRVGERVLKKRQPLLQEGEPADAVYFLHEGKVRLAKMNPDGQEKVVSIVDPGDIFGEIVAFDPGPSPYTAETMEPARVSRLPLEEFRQLVADHPPLAAACLQVEARRLRQAYRHMKNLALLDTYGRVAARLFKLAHDYGVPDSRGTRIDFNLTRQELAQIVGTSRETVSRILAEYERLKILEVERQQIVICDLEELKLRATGGR